jgi:hypothetical protein
MAGSPQRIRAHLYLLRGPETEAELNPVTGQIRLGGKPETESVLLARDSGNKARESTSARKPSVLKKQAKIFHISELGGAL